MLITSVVIKKLRLTDFFSIRTTVKVKDLRYPLDMLIYLKESASPLNHKGPYNTVYS